MTSALSNVNPLQKAQVCDSRHVREAGGKCRHRFGRGDPGPLVNLASETVQLRFAPEKVNPDDIVQAIRNAGYDAFIVRSDQESATEVQRQEMLDRLAAMRREAFSDNPCDLTNQIVVFT